MADSEHAITSALADYHSNKFKSQNAAADAYGVPRSTFKSRLRGSQSTRISHEHLQRLSHLQEEFLVKWILDEEARGYAPTHARCREMASRILEMNGDHRPLGKLWVPHFIKRNPRVKTVIGKKLEAARASGVSPEIVTNFFSQYSSLQKEYYILAENTYNMDETGVALGVCNNATVLASSASTKVYTKTPENREWVSIIETISAAGSKITPVVIFKGKNLQTSWFSVDSIPDWYYTTSQNGWMSNEIGSWWLQHVFEPKTRPAAGIWRLLILDGHGSHVPTDFQYFAWTHKIYLLYLPAHSSHVLQPLDLAAFSVVKSRYRTLIRELAALDNSISIKKQRFIKYYNRAQQKGLTKIVI